jgi:molybdopterin molybdotransferase
VTVRRHPADELSWPDARTTAGASGTALPPESRPLADCAGLALAEPLTALSELPAFDTSAMDGYAVAGEAPWTVVGEVLAGTAWPDRLTAGSAVGIATGAPVPEGVTAVLPVEQATRSGDAVDGAVQAGRHIRRRGEECRAGELLVPAGTPVGAAVLGLAAATGHDTLRAHPLPRVVALITGDELLERGLPRGGQVRDALGPQLTRLVAGHGGALVARSHVPDRAELLVRAVDDAGADVVVTTGASSVGPADHLRRVLGELGAEVLVDGVACRPGHPQLLARLPDGRIVVGLPGNPLAAVVAAVTVLAPLLAGLAGRSPVPPRTALLSTAVRSAPDATRLLPVRLAGLRAEPVRHTGPGMLRGAALADALAVVPPGSAGDAGSEVEVLPLP